jgi:hypothetical protein
MTAKAKASSSVARSNGDIVLDCTFRGVRTTTDGTHIALIELPDKSVAQAWSETLPTLKRGDVVDARYYKGKSDIVFSLYSY